ncbi:hypothetical protein PA08_1098 [Cutibacterium modestum P08]|nr:hypothetical protein PA08_1098 [Cutibacterium modestum P08]
MAWSKILASAMGGCPVILAVQEIMVVAPISSIAGVAWTSSG